MNLKKALLIIAVIIITSAILFNYTTAASDPLLLPKGYPVILEASNGTQSYFLTKLSNVPSYYDVTDGVYLGWCIDTRTELPRSPAKHTVLLYSSLTPSELPAELAKQKWNIVNYILNNKPAGAQAQDIQEAIWYFINLDGGYTPKSNVAKALVAEAEAKGAYFVPTLGQVAAVIAVPVYPSVDVQVSVIEVTISIRAYPTPPEVSPTPTPNPAASPSPTPTPSISPAASPTPTPESQGVSPSGNMNNPTSPQATPTPSSPTPTPTSPSTSPAPTDQDSSSPTPGNAGEPQGISLYIIAVIVLLIALLTSLLIVSRRRKRRK
ncbi:MAG: hypothetical protein ACPLKZ_01185 [Candidatus Bathyarchaeales archaeon]